MTHRIAPDLTIQNGHCSGVRSSKRSKGKGKGKGSWNSQAGVGAWQKTDYSQNWQGKGQRQRNPGNNYALSLTLNQQQRSQYTQAEKAKIACPYMTSKGHCRFGDQCQWSHQEQVVATAYYQHCKGKYTPPKPKGDHSSSFDQPKQATSASKGKGKSRKGKGKGKGKGYRKGKGKGKGQSSRPKGAVAGAVAAQADQPTGNGPASPFEDENKKTLYAIVDQDQWQEDNEQWNEESWDDYQEEAQDSGDQTKH